MKENNFSAVVLLPSRRIWHASLLSAGEETGGRGTKGMNRKCKKGRVHVVLMLLVIWVTFSILSLKGQAQQKTFEQLWMNIPSSPLEIGLNSSRRYSMLQNRSSGRVVQYRLGCVVGAEAEKIKIVQKLEAVDTDLEPGKGLINSVGVHRGEMERCEKMNAQLAVIEVVFKDGFTWKAR